MRLHRLSSLLIAVVTIPLWGTTWGVLISLNGGLGSVSGIAWGLLIGAAVVSAYTDIRWRRIYNAVTYPTFGCLIAINIVAEMGWGEERLGAIGLGSAFAGAVFCFLITAIPYFTGTGGAGDAKLGAVIGTALGVEQGILAVLVSFVVAGVLAVIVLIWDRGPLYIAKMLYHRIGHFFVPLWVAPPSEEQRALFREPIPMAPSFLIGIVLTSLPQFRAFWG